MCTLLLALEQHPRYPLVLAANRDEFYDRPTAPAAFWPDASDVFGGRDLRRGGSWLAVTRDGRLAALTNYRERHEPRPNAPSRGDLVTEFVSGEAAPEGYLQLLREKALPYSGYNLLVGNWQRLFHYSNKNDQVLRLTPGVHGLSNHLLDTPWPKVVRGKEALTRVLERDDFSAEELFAILVDTTKAPDDQVPDTGVGLEWERLLSSIFITSERYGTRSSTVLLVDVDGQATFIERTFDGGKGEVVQRFDWSK